MNEHLENIIYSINHAVAKAAIWGFLFIAIGLAELIYRINFFAPKIERWENKDGTN